MPKNYTIQLFTNLTIRKRQKLNKFVKMYIVKFNLDILVFIKITLKKYKNNLFKRSKMPNIEPFCNKYQNIQGEKQQL